MLGLGVSAAVAAALATGAIASWRPRLVEAQMDPADAGTELAAEDYDPALIGTDPAQIGTDPTLAGTDVVVAAPATPVVSPEPLVPQPTWEPTDAGMSTSLGGSDVAVASVGQSNQVDAPGRRTNKKRGENKRP